MTPHLVGHTFRPPVGSPGYNRLFERRPYKTLDGYICASPYNEKQWRLFFDLIERGDLKEAPRFAGTAGIAKNVAELYQLFADAMLTRTTAEWLVALEAIDVPSMPYHTPESIQEDPHLVATGFFQDVEHPTEGAIRTMAVPTRWSTSKPTPERQAPRLGQHSEELLREAGFSDAEIADMLAKKVSLGQP
jgi:crotonobetainyl-CoA:carnitine CoA-transferase CaiB-like acyl-CoA transferase